MAQQQPAQIREPVFRVARERKRLAQVAAVLRVEQVFVEQILLQQPGDVVGPPEFKGDLRMPIGEAAPVRQSVLAEIASGGDDDHLAVVFVAGWHVAREEHVEDFFHALAHRVLTAAPFVPSDIALLDHKQQQLVRTVLDRLARGREVDTELARTRLRLDQWNVAHLRQQFWQQAIELVALTQRPQVLGEHQSHAPPRLAERLTCMRNALPTGSSVSRRGISNETDIDLTASARFTLHFRHVLERPIAPF